MLLYILFAILSVTSAVRPTTLQSTQTDCIIGKNDHCTFDTMFEPYNDQQDTDCDCVPDSCDSDVSDSSKGSLSDCKPEKADNSARIAAIAASLFILLLIYILRNSILFLCCETSEQRLERQRQNEADLKEMNELKSERDELLKSTNNLEKGVDLKF